MTGHPRRAAAFAAIATLTLAAPSLGPATAVPFAAIGLIAVFGVREGRLFDLLARPADYEAGRLEGLAGFSLAIAALAILATAPQLSMPEPVFVAAVFVVAFGALGTEMTSRAGASHARSVVAFVGIGTAAAAAGHLLVGYLVGAHSGAASVVFLGTVGSIAAAILRELLYERDDPIVLLSVGLLLWGASLLDAPLAMTYLLVAVAVTALLGYVSYALGTASVAGALTGVLLGLVTIVYGGFGWFVVLISFYGLGALASKYRYDEKAARGVAEENLGARGTGNVLGNSAVALVAVLGFAIADGLSVPAVVFVLAFAGALSTALADTLSSEIGGLFDTPRLITTLEPVDPGTDGAITWQGTLAGIAGAAIVGGLSAVLLPLSAPLLGAVVIAIGGVAGTTADSLFGATIEGNRLGNQTVNFLATVVGAIVAVSVGIVLI